MYMYMYLLLLVVFVYIGILNVAAVINEIVCYGIGQFSEDITAQYQLGILLGLIDILKVIVVIIIVIVIYDLL